MDRIAVFLVWGFPEHFKGKLAFYIFYVTFGDHEQAKNTKVTACQGQMLRK